MLKVESNNLKGWYNQKNNPMNKCGLILAVAVIAISSVFPADAQKIPAASPAEVCNFGSWIASRFPCPFYFKTVICHETFMRGL